MKGRFLFLLIGMLLVGAAVVTGQGPAPQPTAPLPPSEPDAIQALPFVQVPETAMEKRESLGALVEQLKLIQEEKQKLKIKEQALIADIRKIIEERRNEIQKIEGMLSDFLGDPQKEKSSKVENFMVPGFFR